MTPSARMQAAIDILDAYLDGSALERSLTNWARKSRYAGSKDRAAVRDIVFQSVRCKGSYAAVGGQLSGRGLAVGYAADQSGDPEVLFDGSQYGASALTDTEMESLKINDLEAKANARLDAPEWLLPALERALGTELEPVLAKLRSRAPVFVRVNTSKTSLQTAQAGLAKDNIASAPHALCKTALEITENPRRLNNCKALQDGLIELQDVASQAVCQTVPLKATDRVLDYCAGGGGKSLAFADRPNRAIFAFDVNASRMGDIAARARRASVEIKVLAQSGLPANAPYDVVVCDVPCSGSGAWRRAPEGKWALSPSRLQELKRMQGEILRDAAELVAPDGCLVYATCSMLSEENEDQIEQFLSDNPAWKQVFSRRFSPLEGGDGFFVAHLTQVDVAP